MNRKKELNALVMSIVENGMLYEFRVIESSIDRALAYIQAREYREPVDFDVGQAYSKMHRQLLLKSLRFHKGDGALSPLIKSVGTRLIKKVILLNRINNLKWFSHCRNYWNRNLDEGSHAYEMRDNWEDKADKMKIAVASLKKVLGIDEEALHDT